MILVFRIGISRDRRIDTHTHEPYIVLHFFPFLFAVWLPFPFHSLVVRIRIMQVANEKKKDYSFKHMCVFCKYYWRNCVDVLRQKPTHRCFCLVLLDAIISAAAFTTYFHHHLHYHPKPGILWTFGTCLEFNPVNFIIE